MNTTRSILMLLVGAALSTACEENAVQVITEPSPGGAQVKFFNFGVGAPGVNFYANDTKITAVSTTACAILTDANRDLCTTAGNESTTGVNYGGVGSGGYYSAVVPGQYTLAGRIAAATDKDLAISNLAATLEDGKRYSFYQSGFYNTAAKTVEAFVVEDPLPPQFDYSVAYVRFVHAISNANAMTLYARNTTTAEELPVGGAVSYKGAGAFTALPPGTYDLGARYAGSATNAISRTAVAFAAGRVYTIGARGDITITSTTAANRPFLDNTANR
jgi:hypothetical protein